MLLMFNFSIVFPSAGWMGNDAVTPIVGEHDPYVHVYGRVSFALEL